MTNTHISKDDFLQASKDIDVNEIMEKITIDIENKKNKGVLREQDILEIQHLELQPLPDYEEIPNIYRNHLYSHLEQVVAPNNQGNSSGNQEEEIVNTGKKNSLKSILKSLVKRNIKPIFEKIMGISVEHDNNRFNELYQLYDISKRYNNHSNQRHILHQEYIKLLHNALNNMITESTKLKVEELSLKTRMKNLEDKIVFIEKRQQAIEKRQFNR